MKTAPKRNARIAPKREAGTAPRRGRRMTQAPVLEMPDVPQLVIAAPIAPPLVADVSDTTPITASPAYASPAHVRAVEALIELSECRRALHAADGRVSSSFERMLVETLFPTRGAKA